MAIVLARVDNRLIHGQVLEAWVPHVHADCIVVVDDELAGDSFRCQLMQAVVPSSIAVRICSHAQLEEAGGCDFPPQARVLLLFATPAEALYAYRHGCRFDALNLGNMHAGACRCCISTTLYMDDQDIEDLEELARLGVDISAQCVPSDKILHWDCRCRKLR